MRDKMDEFLKPEGVVVIGASRNEQKLGYGVARNLIESGYSGNIRLVNPKGGELFGHKIYPSLEGIKVKIDLAVIVVPAKYVLKTLIACSQKEIKNIIIVSGGFGETGEKGAALEEELKKIVSEHQMRILGPNCIGLIDTHLPLDTSFIQPPMPEPGDIAFISQSGALGAAIIDWARSKGFGFSKVVSLGNRLDVSESDFLLPYVQSNDTAVITMYLESIQDGQKFVETASHAAAVKPLVAMKVGLSEAGKSAASSHTGALAGADAAYEAAFRRSGVVRAQTTEEMFEWAKMLAWSPSFPINNRVAILTNAGGPGVTAADAVDLAGLRMARLDAKTISKLKKTLPVAASLGNPIDMLASASPKVYAESLDALLKDEGVDMVLVIAPPPPMFEALDIAEAVLPIIRRSKKPVAVSFMGSTLVRDAIGYLRKNNVPEFYFPEQAVGALSALWQYSQLQKRNTTIEGYRSSQKKCDVVKGLLSGLADRKGFVPPEKALEIMQAYQIPVLDIKLAKSGTEAIDLASRIGYPIVMKIASEELSHKTDMGGVVLNLKSSEAVKRSFEVLMERVREEEFEDKVFGVYLQPMITGGQEVIVGAVRDPVFGPMVMFGSGGIEVEGLGDVQFTTTPLIKSELDFILENTWAGKKLKGFRHLEPADVPAVKKVLIKIGQLMIDYEEIREIEVNPLIVMGKDKGAYAVDVRILL